MMNIYMHELKMKSRSVLIWTVSITLLLFVFLSIFSSLGAEKEAFRTLMDNYPKELLAAFGMDQLDMTTILGYFSFVLVFCQLCVSIQAANYGVSLVSVEEREMTADFLLAKPVRRAKIMTSKLLAAITGLAITNIIVCLSTVVFINMFNGESAYDGKVLALLLFSITFLQLFFLMVGLIISLIMKRVRSVTSVSMGLVFGLYILKIFSGSLEKDKYAYITPFKHFESNQIVKTGAYEMDLVLITVAVILFSMIGSYLLYHRRDIHSL